MLTLDRLNRRKFGVEGLREAARYLADGRLPDRLASKRQQTQFRLRWDGFSGGDADDRFPFPAVYYGARRVVPREHVPEVLGELYTDPRTTGGRDRLFERAKAAYVGVSRRAVMCWLRNHEVWQLRRPAFAPRVRQPIVSTRPFQRVQVDLVDLRAWHPALNNGARWLLTAVDTFTKHAWAVPLPDKRARTVAQAMDERVLSSMDRAPSVVQTDRGSEFVSGEFQAALRRHNVKHVMSRPYTPQSQGQIERWHSTLKTLLRQHLAQFTGSRRWVDVLPLLLENYNSSKHSATGFTPLELVQAWREADDEESSGPPSSEGDEGDEGDEGGELSFDEGSDLGSRRSDEGTDDGPGGSEGTDDDPGSEGDDDDPGSDEGTEGLGTRASGTRATITTLAPMRAPTRASGTRAPTRTGCCRPRHAACGNAPTAPCACPEGASQRSRWRRATTPA